MAIEKTGRNSYRITGDDGASGYLNTVDSGETREAVQQTQVSEQQDGLQYNVECLDKLIGVLEERLEKVLSLRVDKMPDDEKKERELVPLARFLATMNNLLKGHSERVDSILRRLEL